MSMQSFIAEQGGKKSPKYHENCYATLAKTITQRTDEQSNQYIHISLVKLCKSEKSSVPRYMGWAWHATMK